MGKFVYTRIALTGQGEDDFRQSMIADGFDEHSIFIDKMGGKNSNCLNYNKLLKKLQPDDVVFISSIGCLGVGYDDIISQWKIITQKKMADIWLWIPLCSIHGRERKL